VIDMVATQLARGPWLLGERFTAADVLWGTALRWTTGFGIVPKLPVITDYIERVSANPAFVRAGEKDAALMAALSAAAPAG
jgi:glutathione S-transferase